MGLTSKVRNRPWEAGLMPEPHWATPHQGPEPKESWWTQTSRSSPPSPLPRVPTPCPSPGPTRMACPSEPRTRPGSLAKMTWKATKVAPLCGGKGRTEPRRILPGRPKPAGGRRCPSGGRQNQARGRGLVSHSDNSLSKVSRGRGQAHEEASPAPGSVGPPRPCPPGALAGDLVGNRSPQA